MNRKMILYFLGQILRVEGVLMLLPLTCSLIYREKSYLSFLIVATFLIVLGTITTIKKPKNTKISSKEGIAIVGLSWILLSLFGALPFYMSGNNLSFIDCFFETVSGFTTTGSTILTNVEALADHGLYFWRSFTHWIGGMGVLVFFLAIMPQSDAASSRFLYVMRAEATGPKVGKMVAKLKSTAIITYTIYLALTVIELIFLLCGGMPFFDSLLNTFGTAGTGGFAVKNLSIGAYQSPYAEYVIGIFMMLFGINFNLFYLILLGQFLKVIKNQELICYLGIIAAATVTIAINILNMYNSFAESFRHAFFQVTSIISTTGYATADFNTWPELSRFILVLLMIFGACAGSTGGGFKVIRILILIKNSLREIKYILHPKSVNVVKIDKKAVDHEVVRGTNAYLVIYLLIMIFSILLITALNNFDMITNSTAVISCFNNIGPGLEVVGPMGSFAGYSPLSKLILSFNMLAGRLELFPILMLFSPKLWRRR